MRFASFAIPAASLSGLALQEKHGMLFLINALHQWLNSSKSCDFGELQGFALRINRFAVYSADIIITLPPMTGSREK
jgi:hypothetical protein